MEMKLSWTQDAFNVYVNIVLAEESSRRIKVDMQNGNLKVMQGTEIVLNSKLAYPAMEDTLQWFMDGQQLEIQLGKPELASWSRLFVTDTEADAHEIEPEPISDISAFDAETQMMIQKMLVEQKQHQ
ncbi:hypothetical protein NECID01_0821 [Nematocida sp. AWRm77]|nr:hypothetical protein NECID01_0821 [Nematocida sp. AWRm77]